MGFQSGGAFLPSSDTQFTGAVDLPATTTIGGSNGVAGTAVLLSTTGTQTLTNKTLTSPTITNPTTSTGTFTSPTIVGTPVINTLKSNFSTATVSGGYNADTYLAGSAIGIPTGGFVAGAKYTCIFDMVKTAAGTAAFTVNLRIGTGGGVVGDTSVASYAFAVGTAAVDTGRFVLEAYFRTVGSGTSAVIVGSLSCQHALAATGLITTGASGFGAVTNVSSGFDSTIAATTIGISVNGGASFSGTNTYVEAFLQSY